MNTSISRFTTTAFLSSIKSPVRAYSVCIEQLALEKERKLKICKRSNSDKKMKTFSTSTRLGDESLSSNRGRNAIGLLPTYLSDARAVKKYDCETCPDGALQLSVAENQMLEDLLVPSYSEFSAGYKNSDELSSVVDISSHFYADQIYYQPTHGRPILRRNMAYFLEKMLKIPSNTNLCQDNLILGAGCNAVLENLVFCLADIGDPVLIPTPYYAAFEFDLVARAGVEIVPVKTEECYYSNTDSSSASHNHNSAIIEESYYPTPESLDKAYEEALKRTGRKPRILLISHPNNPLGICYPRQVLSDCIDWAKKNEIHLISDEIYAGSVYKPANFQSVLSVASQNVDNENKSLGLGPYIHFVYALSKDFASSGLRVGVAYTENESIVLPMQKLNDLCQISSQTQLLVERMLEPNLATDWAQSFLEENQSRIKKRSNTWTKCLDQLNIPYLEPDSGLFVWMDFGEFLPELNDSVPAELQKEERESTLYLDLMHKHGLLFTPGLSMRNHNPGFFRCVFTAATDLEFSLALDRLRSFVERKRNENKQ